MRTLAIALWVFGAGASLTGCPRPPTGAETTAASERAACAELATSIEAGVACLDAVDCRYGVGPCPDGGSDGSVR